MEKVKIKIQYKWSYLQFIFLSLLMLLLTVLPLLIFDTSNDEYIYQMIWFIGFPTLAIIMIIFSLIYYQIAEISNESIKIYSKLFHIKEIKWAELKKIQLEKLATGTAGFSVIYKEWIVLYTDLHQTRTHGGINKANKGPWYIAYTINNAKIIKDFCQKYNDKIEIIL